VSVSVHLLGGIVFSPFNLGLKGSKGSGTVHGQGEEAVDDIVVDKVKEIGEF